MKKIIVVLFISVLGSSFVFAQTDCKPYTPSTKGSKWEITDYSPKDKIMGKTSFELVDIVDIAGGTKFIIKSTSYDKKGKEVFKINLKPFVRMGNLNLIWLSK